MTRKDYVLIAEVLRLADLSTEDRKALAIDFCWKLAEADPRFNATRFCQAVVGEAVAS